MASTLPSIPDKPNNVGRRLITSVWLIITLLSCALTLALWMFSSVPAFETEPEALNEPTIEEVALNIGQIRHIDEVHQLEDAVQPISFDALVRDLRDYPPEFKDSKYLKANKGKWTVQVMDVSEHEVVTDYLTTRDDREKFAYFRYRDSNNQARYLLTYDTMPSPQMAMGVAKTIDFKLPANVRVLPEEIDRYLDLIENYELSEPIKDLSRNRPRQIKLQPTKRELGAKRQKKPTEEKQKTEDEEGDTNSASADNAEAAANDTNIKGSKDTNDTLSVKEKRILVEKDAVPPSSPQNPSLAQQPQPELPKKPTVTEPASNQAPSPADDSQSTQAPKSNGVSETKSAPTRETNNVAAAPTPSRQQPTPSVRPTTDESNVQPLADENNSNTEQ